jgi:predicted DNA-binding transcriptional regulator AlpA
VHRRAVAFCRPYVYSACVVISGDFMGTEKNTRLLRLREVSELTSLGKTTIKLWVAKGKFPPPTALSATIKVWRHSDVEEWIGKVFTDATCPVSKVDGQTENVVLLHSRAVR